MLGRFVSICYAEAGCLGSWVVVDENYFRYSDSRALLYTKGDDGDNDVEAATNSMVFFFHHVEEGSLSCTRTYTTEWLALKDTRRI